MQILNGFLNWFLNCFLNEREALLLGFQNSNWPMDGITSKLVFNLPLQKDEASWIRTLGFVHILNPSGIHLLGLWFWVQQMVRWMLRGSWISVQSARFVCHFIFVFLLVWTWFLQDFRFGFLKPVLLVLIQVFVKKQGIRLRLFVPIGFVFGSDFLVSLIWPKPFALEGRLFYTLAVSGGLLGREMAVELIQRNSIHHSGVKVLIEHWSMALFSWVILIPYEVIEHGLVSLGTPLWSLITVPVITLILYPILVLGTVLSHLNCSVENWMAMLAIVFEIILNKGFDLSLSLGNLWVIPRFGLLWMALVSVFIGFLPRRIKLGLCFGITVVLTSRMIWNLNRPMLHENGGSVLADVVVQLDVGQGDSALVLTKTKSRFFSGLIDAGSGRKVSSYQWILKFAKYSVTELSWLTLTHTDEDHAGGVKWLSLLLPIQCEGAQCFPFSKQYVESARGSTFLYGRLKGNSKMMTYLVPLSDGRVYLNLGDADSSMELNAVGLLEQGGFLNRSGQRLIFKISHHGSRFSSSEQLLQKLRPEIAWISAGLRNGYGHPTYEVLKKLSQLKIPYRRTDREGDLSSDLNSTSSLSYKLLGDFQWF